MPKKTRVQAKRQEQRDYQVLLAIVLGIGGYIVMEIFFRRTQPHLVHWITAIVAAVIGYLGLAIWFIFKRKL